MSLCRSSYLTLFLKICNRFLQNYVFYYIQHVHPTDKISLPQKKSSLSRAPPGTCLFSRLFLTVLTIVLLFYKFKEVFEVVDLNSLPITILLFHSNLEGKVLVEAL